MDGTFEEPYSPNRMIPADHASSLVTFVWRAKENTRSMAVVDCVAGFDSAATQMSRLGSTDLWYKTYAVRNDARFTYQFSLNDLQQRFDKLDPKDIAGWIKFVRCWNQIHITHLSFSFV